MPQEIYHGGIDLRCTLLLSPMAAAGEHDLAAQSRHLVFQIGDKLIPAAKRNHYVAVAGYVKRRDRNLGACKRRQQLPISVDVTVPI